MNGNNLRLCVTFSLRNAQKGLVRPTYPQQILTVNQQGHHGNRARLGVREAHPYMQHVVSVYYYAPFDADRECYYDEDHYHYDSELPDKFDSNLWWFIIFIFLWHSFAEAMVQYNEHYSRSNRVKYHHPSIVNYLFTQRKKGDIQV
jgi:hypothetical protein